MSLINLFGDPPRYLAPGEEPSTLSRPATGVLFGLFPAVPAYVGTGQPVANGGGWGFGLFPEGPRYVMPRDPEPDTPAPTPPVVN